jgi:HAD superfamily hydrolase (TIGR01484 family)
VSKRKVIVFDLDDTLAVTKSPISDEMSERLRELLEIYEICVISGGNFHQFKVQVVDRMQAEDRLLERMHLMPTCGTRYFRYDAKKREWNKVYAENLTEKQKREISDVLEEAARHFGYWPEKPIGEIIEDRESQITFSGLGQFALPEDKYKWDPDGVKKHKIRDYAADRLPEFEFRVGGTTSIDATKPGIDKAYGMKKLMEHIKIKRKDILFFGDKLEEGGNDYPVKAMGIDCITVKHQDDTVLALEAIIQTS